MALSQSKEIQDLMQSAELAYLRDRQQALFTLAFIGRIEWLLLAHLKYIKKFNLLLQDVNSDIRQQSRKVA